MGDGMAPEWVGLAAAMLDTAADSFANHGCNDWQWPADWSRAKRRRLAVEPGIGLERQVIGRHVGGPEGDGRADVRKRPVHRLARQRVHQVDVEGVEAVACFFDGGDGLVSAVHAAQHLQARVARRRVALQHDLEAGVDHVSAYALIVEDGTALARKVRRGEILAPDDDVPVVDGYAGLPDAPGIGSSPGAKTSSTTTSSARPSATSWPPSAGARADQIR